MLLSNYPLILGVQGLRFVCDVVRLSCDPPLQSDYVTLSTYEVIGGDEVQFYSVRWRSGECSVFALPYTFYDNALAFKTDFFNGHIDSTEVNRGEFAIFTVCGSYSDVKFEIDDLIDFSFGRNTDKSDVYDYFFDYDEG